MLAVVLLQGSEVFESSPSQMNQLHIDTMQRSFTSQRSPSSLRCAHRFISADSSLFAIVFILQ